MKKHMLALAVLILSVPTVARASDELMPANTEDLEQFDKILATQKHNDLPAKRDNFGQAVQAEAHKLKEDRTRNKADFGKWVSGQRRHNEKPASPDQRSGNGSRQGNGSEGRGRHRGH